MPHCIVEYACDLENELNPLLLVQATYLGALESGLFKREDIKSRGIPYNYYQIGELRLPFVHITCKILEGRTTEQRLLLSQCILRKVQAITTNKSEVTVEVLQMESASYSKFV